MSTSPHFPPVLSGDDDWEKVAKEIAFLTAILKECQHGTIKSPPKNSNLQLFQYISTLVTTGEFAGKDRDVTGAIVNAVTGRVDVDKIVSVVFTRNAVPDLATNRASYSKITASKRGKVLLNDWEDMQSVVSFDVHLQDVVDILGYLLGDEHDQYDAGRTRLFIHRRAFPKLSARVRSATRLWCEAPFHIVARYYEDRPKFGSPIDLPSASFLLRDKGMQNDLAEHGLHRDTTYTAQHDSNRYSITSENVGQWAKFVDFTYSKIEHLVQTNLDTTTGTRIGATPLSTSDTRALVEAVAVFDRLIMAQELMAFIFSPDDLELKLMQKFLEARNKQIARANKPVHSQTSTSEATEDVNDVDDEEEELEEDDASDGARYAGGGAHVLRYCRIITAWHEAISNIIHGTSRLPSPVNLQVFRVTSIPRPHNVLPQDHIDFKKNYLAYLQGKEKDAERLKSARKFVNARIKLGLSKKVRGATIHAEAIAMGLVCISVLNGEAFGSFTKKWTDETLPTSGDVTIAVSKKCCACCTMLGDILTEHAEGVRFVLPGSHATFLPWSPPRGVPLAILREMRDRICTAFHNQACTYFAIAPSTHTSPATSEHVDLPSDDLPPLKAKAP